MTILALDSSGLACSAAVWQDGAITAACRINNGNTHSETLMPLVECVLQGAGTQASRLDYIACVTGPGSFTGVRIGVSTARALSFAHGIPCIAVTSLEALANVPFVGTVCPLLDARRGQVYCAAFENDERKLPERAMALEDFLADVSTLKAGYLFTGDGAAAYREQIMRALGERAYFAPAHLCLTDAAAAACVAAGKTEEATDGSALLPYYLRAPQAEREFGQRNG